jgi:Probable cobalt transporter subunit (CbtB)
VSQAAAERPIVVPAPIPLRDIAPWALFAGVILMAVLYLVGMDQGATSVFSGQMLHEFMHDGRHLLGFPCH